MVISVTCRKAGLSPHWDTLLGLSARARNKDGFAPLTARADPCGGWQVIAVDGAGGNRAAGLGQLR